MLFTTGYIIAREFELKTFIALATHAEYGKYVKTIVYDSNKINVFAAVMKSGSISAVALAKLYCKKEFGSGLDVEMEKAFINLSNVTCFAYRNLSYGRDIPKNAMPRVTLPANRCRHDV